MTQNESIAFRSGKLYVDDIPVSTIVEQMGTPLYVYSLKRAVSNFRTLRAAFAGCDAHLHYSAKANANLTILRTLIAEGAGIDAVSAGEIYRALQAGAKPADIVFAGVGKSASEIRYALEQGIGWFNVENIGELALINAIAGELGREQVRIALRLNPDITANTHPYIATGHGGAKFGLTTEHVIETLGNQQQYKSLHFAGIHVHIGSQLQDTKGTVQAVEKATSIAAEFASVDTINIGGGIPARYSAGQSLPAFENFAEAVQPLLKGYQVLLEPGRSIIADAGILLTSTLYTKDHAGQHIAIVDASMTELIRPALYQAKHEILPVIQQEKVQRPTQVVGPVCETADVLGRDVTLPQLEGGDVLAIFTAGAYGTVMASNYNARVRPAEVAVAVDGSTWSVIRKRETWEDLIRAEQLD